MSRHHILLLAALVGTSLFSLVYAIRERSEANAMEHSRNQLDATLSAARAEIQTLTSRLDALTTAVVGEPASKPPVHIPTRLGAVGRRSGVVPPPGRSKNLADPRWKRVESQLAEHQSQLADHRQRIEKTQDDVRRTGDQLDGKINSTRDELNRSIATTHDDVVLLQKRGERNIFEFELTKSKQFQRVGPLSLSLRKADTKHQRYDLSLMVDDKPIEKQHVNLSEPVWITIADLSQPIQLVVNQIDKNRIRGYVNAPRYKNAELAALPAPSTAQTPTLKPR